MSPNEDTPDLDSAISRYQPYLSAADFFRVQACAHTPAPIALRINRLKVSNPCSSIQRWAQQYGWELKPLSFCSDAWQVLSAQVAPSQTPEHQLGCFYLQDAASILPATLFSQETTPALTLDMAASPGGKTTHLIDLDLDRSLIVANDSSAGRMPALRTVLQQWGATNAVITNFPGEIWGTWFPECFDRVLLDAPCSMEGLRNTPTHPFRPISADERQRLALRQTAMLESALRTLRVGGELVYSTCSLAPEEDEAVVDTLLRTYPHMVSVAPAPNFGAAAPALTEFGGTRYHPQLAQAMRLWPFTFNTNGFFAVKLLKTAALPLIDAKPIPERPFRKTGLRRPTQELEADIRARISSSYGVDLDTLMQKHKLSLYQRESNFLLLPQSWLDNFANLPYYAIGLVVGTLIKSRFEISADFVLRFGDAFNKGFLILSDEYIPQWLSGSDLRKGDWDRADKRGIYAVRSSSGLNLGAGKSLPGRLRNLLPRRHLRLS